jgi:hypothetical protein
MVKLELIKLQLTRVSKEPSNMIYKISIGDEKRMLMYEVFFSNG